MAILFTTVSSIFHWVSVMLNVDDFHARQTAFVQYNLGVDGGMKDLLISNRPSSFEDCVSWARLKFESYFVNRIKEFTFNYPAEAVTSKGMIS